MKPRFADTGYFIALLNPGDQLHFKAVEIAKKLDNQPIVTSDLVLIELLNDFSDRGEIFRRSVSEFIKCLQMTAHIQIIRVDSILFEKAFSLYRDRLDKAWSLTDCASFVIMSQAKITDALAHDKHFIQAGFRAILREP